MQFLTAICCSNNDEDALTRHVKSTRDDLVLIVRKSKVKQVTLGVTVESMTDSKQLTVTELFFAAGA